jgi:hypothetical protein
LEKHDIGISQTELTVPSGPCLDDVDVVRGCTIYSSHTY